MVDPLSYFSIQPVEHWLEREIAQWVRNDVPSECLSCQGHTPELCGPFVQDSGISL